ncbi:hypothetical protein HOY82DRAFT_601158 [Tuber indicum]|nr:hypothetical protein HOY82DRAFT_601158 [Tuber indicum]
MTSKNTLVSHVEHQRQLSKLEALWYQRFMQQQQEKEKRLSEEREKREKRLEEMQEENDALQCNVLCGYTERMMLAHNFNVHGALEHIVFQARPDKNIGSEFGTEKGLNELAQKTEFKEILEKEAQEHRLVQKQVEYCFPDLYHRASTHANGNDCIIAIRAADFTATERAALAVLLKLQSKRSYPLDWREEEEKVMN